MWVKIEHQVRSTFYGGGTVVPSGTYAQTPLAPRQGVVWAPKRTQAGSLVFVVVFGTADIRIEAVSDRQWEDAFAASQDFLMEWGDRVLADFLAGKTEPLDPDKL